MKLTALALTIGALATIASLPGNGLAMSEVCYQQFDLNKGECAPNQRGILPSTTLANLDNIPSNPEIDERAELTKAQEIRQLTPDNPYKQSLAIGGLLFSGAAYLLSKKSTRNAIFSAPQERLDYQNSLSMAKARAKLITVTQLGKLNPSEIEVLRAAITPQEYLEYGWALDSGENAWKMELLKQSGYEGQINLAQLSQAPLEMFMPSQQAMLESTPASLAPTPENLEDLRQNGLKAVQALVSEADKSVLGGCVMLAAPGGGKTTFLMTAWGRLRNTYGNKFKSLAVVVKPTDKPVFSAVADECLLVGDSPRTAAVAILEFIRESMGAHGQVRRLFLDDFLTMNKKFSAALKGLWVNPLTLAVTTGRGDDPDAQPLLETLEAELNNLWLVGREYNSALWVSSHSPNVDALPFVGSKDSRSVGQIVFLCKSDKRDFIEGSLNNPNLIPSNTKRALLKQTLDSLQGVVDERIVLSNDDNWTLGIVPSSINQEYKNYRILWGSTMAPDLPVIEPEVLEEVVEVKLSVEANKVHGYLLRVNESRDVSTIRKSTRLNLDEVRKALNELLGLNLIVEDTSGAYRVQDN
jgi:hypothetical protein